VPRAFAPGALPKNNRLDVRPLMQGMQAPNRRRPDFRVPRLDGRRGRPDWRIRAGQSQSSILVYNIHSKTH
jgi:hypothetical protein